MLTNTFLPRWRGIIQAGISSYRIRTFVKEKYISFASQEI
jgi:hypothetical protein